MKMGQSRIGKPVDWICGSLMLLNSAVSAAAAVEIALGISKLGGIGATSSPFPYSRRMPNFPYNKLESLIFTRKFRVRQGMYIDDFSRLIRWSIHLKRDCKIFHFSLVSINPGDDSGHPLSWGVVARFLPSHFILDLLWLVLELLILIEFVDIWFLIQDRVSSTDFRAKNKREQRPSSPFTVHQKHICWPSTNNHLSLACKNFWIIFRGYTELPAYCLG